MRLCIAPIDSKPRPKCQGEVLISKASQTCNEGQYKMNYERVLEVKKEEFP